MGKSLTSIPTLVEAPFIVVEIGGVTFGTYQKGGTNAYGFGVNVEYPNYMKKVDIVKVDGTVNTYTLSFSYQVPPGGDPNLLDKIFSKAVKDRKIKFKYGDWNAPTYIYKEEVALITSVNTNLNMANASIDYTVKCTSDAIGLSATRFNFPAKKAKPSEVLQNMLRSNKYGLNTVFTGMKNINGVLRNNLIATNDKVVTLNAQNDTNALTYMNYLVDSMTNQSNITGGISDSKYYLTIHDDYTNNLGGTYFKVTEVSKNTKTINSIDTYELDVNYPGDNFVTSFNLHNDQSWAILYEYGDELNQDKYTYDVDENGKVVTTYAPSLIRSPATNGLSASKSSWWTLMTQFPVKASVTIKGLTRPSMLMTYVKVNVIFNGAQKHISSGLYIITKQTDTIDTNGYKTVLELLRVGGD